MSCYDFRHRAAAQWFLSSISLDGSSCDFSKTGRCSRGIASQGFLKIVEDDEKDSLEFAAQPKISAGSHKSDLSQSQKSADFQTRKNVCFGEVFEEGASNGNEPSASIHPNPVRSISSTSGQLCLRHELLTHPGNESFRFAISTVGQRRPPIVVASVIPISRDPLMLSGIQKVQNGTAATISGGSGSSSRQRSVPEMPTALLSTLFRHNTSGNTTANSPINNCPRSGSIGQEENLTIAKPLSYSKPVDSVERSYAHFLFPRRSLQHSLSLATPATDLRQSGRRRRAETVAGDEVQESEKIPSRSPSTTAESNNRQCRSRSHTLSFSSMASAISRHDESSSPLRETGGWGPHSVDSTAYPSSLENIQPSQAVFYEDPLISYNPLLLDDPMVPRVTNRRVFPFQGYMTSILGYRRADEHKKSINREFHQRFPNVQLTLTKMRSIKLNILAIALRMNLDLWIVAHAYVLFEKMILKLFVCKANRKLCAGAALLISAKLNDLKGPVMPAFMQEIENEFRISHRDLIHMEMAAFIGLEFCVLPSPTEAFPHFTQIQKSLGVVITTPCCLSVSTRPHSLEDENLQTPPSSPAVK
nr:cdk5 and abl1 enzyme substrate 1 [Hymenolepis microstoma]